MSDVVDLIEDDDFLSMVEAAEGSAKRQKLSAAAENSEGSYMAALRGSRSLQWQQQQLLKINRKSFDSPSRSQTNPSGRFAPTTSAFAADSSPSTRAADACFKCGKSGHWARECAAFSSAGGDGGQGNRTEIADKPCPCGSGACLVLTANTEKNRGRKFYRCPVREENGGCNFFEWCENTSGVASSMGGLTSSSVPDLPCPCGAGACLVLTAKTEKNRGQQFYRCPANPEASCGFFKWCSDRSSPVACTPISYSQSSDTWNDTSGQQFGGKSSSSCFKCGQEGHWARDCCNKSLKDAADIGGKPASSNACYKCGKTGHWARDCSVDDTKTRSRKAAASFHGK